MFLMDVNIFVDGKVEGLGGMFGFFKSKKGWNNSLKLKERGVLGKEGVRVVIGWVELVRVKVW